MLTGPRAHEDHAWWWWRCGALHAGRGRVHTCTDLRDAFVEALAQTHPVDYCDRMIASVRESKARFSELIAKASAVEEVMITVRGKPAVKLVTVPSQPSQADFKAWAKRRRERLTYMPEPSDTSSDIIEALREERF